MESLLFPWKKAAIRQVDVASERNLQINQSSTTRGGQMKTNRPTILVLAFLLLPAAAGLAQNKLKIDPEQKYLLLATNKTSTMQKELEEAAAQGFRVLTGASNCGQMEMVLFLGRTAQPPDTFKYQLLATTRTSSLEKELNEAARQGYRLLPDTLMAKENLLSKEIVAVLEKAHKPDKQYEYKLLATSLTSTLQKEVFQAEADGFALIGMVARGENMVILERASPARAGN
jgi:hypothetical protein